MGLPGEDVMNLDTELIIGVYVINKRVVGIQLVIVTYFLHSHYSVVSITH